jgi:hypothetical protein
MNCDFTNPGCACPECGYKAKHARVHRYCTAPRKALCRAGCRLTKLLCYIGATYTADCDCKSESAKMNAGTTTIDATIEVMREEAERRKLTFVESQARWLIELAHKLADENREPTRIERVRLRAMRLGNRLINGSQAGSGTESASTA